jgi:beta-glucosidase
MNCTLKLRAAVETLALCVALVVALRTPSARGQSVSPDGSSTPAAVENQVEAMLNRMSLEEKIELLGGVDGFFVRAMPSLGLPTLKMADGPMGVRNYGPATAMPAGINLAATWDVALAREVGEQIGADARAKGVNFLLGPGVNIRRSPLNGRGFEYFGEDPYLASRVAVAYIEGVQSTGVSATIKHFMGNNSEYARHSSDDVIDERTMREIYLPTFEAAVKEAHVGAVMNSYNLVGGAHATQNAFLDSEILKKEWGFRGVLMSDWFSTYDGIAAANAGLDLEMPRGDHMNGDALLPAVRDGRVPIAVVDDKVRRILRLAVEFHWLDRDQTDYAIPRYNLQGREVALQAAREGMVLLKNDANVLPLSKQATSSIAVIGPDAYPAVPVGGGSAGVRSFSAVSFLEGIANELGAKFPTYYDRGIPELSDLAQRTNFFTTPSGGEPGLMAEYFASENLQGDPVTRRKDEHINFGAVSNPDLGYVPPAMPPGAGSARWTGYYTAPADASYDIFVQATGESGGYYRVHLDEKLILDNWSEARALVGYVTILLSKGPHKVVIEQHGRPGFLGARFRFGVVRQDSYVNPSAEKIAASASAVVIAVGFNAESESEGADRTFRLPPGQDELISRIAAINKHTVVVITAGDAVDMTPWIDHVPGVLQAWYSGQEGGTALAQILLGDVDPSGRLPVSFDRRWEDNPAHDSYHPPQGSNRVAYSEGIFIGYRGYEKNGAKPLFPFGYGLSYTSFSYSDLSIQPVAGSAPSQAPAVSDSNYEVSWTVTNTGNRSGTDVSELYVGEDHPVVPRPTKELKGFARVDLQPGQTQRVKVLVNRRAFSYFDTKAGEWRVEPGQFHIFIGRSVDENELTGTVTLAASTISRSR